MIINSPTPSGILTQLLDVEKGWQGRLDIDCSVIRRLASFIGSTVESYSRIERAMDRAREYIRLQDSLAASVSSGRVITADSMAASKGRFTRAWHAPEGGVWGCLLHANTLLPRSRQFLPLAVGIACCETIREHGVDIASLRWVNDVLVGEKIAGFLIESYTSKVSGEEYNLIGFGINVNNQTFPGELTPIATSLAQCLGNDLDLTAFSQRFLANLAWNIGVIYYEEEQFLREGVYSGHKGKHLVLEKFIQLSDTVGKRVVYGFDVMTAPQYEADVVDVDENGGLIMQFDSGARKVEYSGEVRYL